MLVFHPQEHNYNSSPPMVSKDKVRAQWNTAKTIAKYPTDSMAGLWAILTKHHKKELDQLIKLAQIALTLPLHTAGCERVFSQQNLIVSKQRSRLSPLHSDQLIRVRTEGKGIDGHDFEASLKKWHALKRRKIKTSIKL